MAGSVLEHDCRCGALGHTDITTRHSHSIILSHGNTLIFRHKFFRACSNPVRPIRQKFALFNSKGNFDDSESVRFQ
jgi:hypothetical protein